MGARVNVMLVYFEFVSKAYVAVAEVYSGSVSGDSQHQGFEVLEVKFFPCFNLILDFLFLLCTILLLLILY